LNLPLFQRQALAVVLSSVVASISTYGLILLRGALDGIPWNIHSVARDAVFLLIFVTPIAAAGILLFGLPSLAIVRRMGWISSIMRFRLFGIIAGGVWALLICLLINVRPEMYLFMILVGGVNGLLVAWIWMRIVEKFRAEQTPGDPIPNPLPQGERE
jgi:hypothetical protein